MVTGGSGGIGLGCAEALVGRGYDVVITARSEDRLRAAAERIGARYVVADGADEAQMAAVMEAVDEVHLLVHSAGVLQGTFVRKLSLDDLDTVLRANLRSAFVTTQQILTKMPVGGRLIYIGSSASKEPMKGRTAYSASKAGLDAFASALRREVSRDGINVNVVIPAPVETDILEEVTFEMVALQVSDVADAVLFLDSLHPRVVVPEIYMYANPEGPLGAAAVAASGSTGETATASRKGETEVTSPDEEIPFGRKLAQLAEADPEGVGAIVVAPDGTDAVLTWSALEAGANQWGRVLQARGANIGDRVALAVQNSVDLLLAVLGCWKAGAAPIPVRWDLPDWERGRVLEVIDAAVVVDSTSLSEMRDEAAAADDSAMPDVISPQINGICSSGATGTPKVIMSTRPGVWTPGLGDPFISNWQGTTRPQVILVMGPMYHTNGFAQFNFLLTGDRLVVLEKFDANVALDAIERHRVTNFTATPTMLQRLAAVPGVEKRDLSTVEWILQGAAVMPPSLLRTWFELLAPEKIVMAYGMTEQLGLTALRGDEWLKHEGSVGRGFRDTEIRILDDDKNEVPAGELGDVYMRSPHDRLLRLPRRRGAAAVTADGFGTGGDIGWVDEDGFLYLADRRADMIITGGANVFPAEIESAFVDHPDIADVVVIGLKDEQWGRRVHAVVEAKDKAAPPSEADVIAYAKSKLAGYKVPKTVEFVDAIPRSAATKVSRGAMVDARGG